MTEFRAGVLALFFAASLALGFSCADDHDPEHGPTQEEMQQVAVEYCEHEMVCGFLPARVTLEDCVANQIGTYQDAPECVARYYLDECLTMLTCEDIDRLNHNIDIGSCEDERDAVFNVLCTPPPL